MLGLKTARVGGTCGPPWSTVGRGARGEAVKLGMGREDKEDLMSKPWLGEHILVIDMADEADDDDA